MKKLSFLLSLILLTSSLFAQEKSKERDISANLYNLQNFGLQYKVGDGTSMWRYRIVSGGLDIRSRTLGNPAIPVENRTINYLDFDLGFSVGREKRKDLGGDFQFVYGVELSTTYRFNQQWDLINSDEYQQIGLGLVGVFGLNYSINDRLFVGLELLPSVVLNFDSSYSSWSGKDPYKLEGLDAGFGSNSALISFGFTF